jgi:hypothetical protein
MAHFAKVNDNNVVEQVIVISNEHEANGEAFINDVLLLEGRWIQTSYNAKIRGKYAGIGDIYDEKKDIFYSHVPKVIDETPAE